MTANTIDGKAQAARLLEQVTSQTTEFVASSRRKPGLAVVLVGDDPASGVYVRSKKATAERCGMASSSHLLAASTSQEELLGLINRLNGDESIDGILVQLPLPGHIDSQTIIQAIDPCKDVDGFHPVNTGLLFQGRPQLTPCTPLGCLHLLKSVHPNPVGMRVLVIGRSNIVGRPLAALLLSHDCTVTIAHSRSRETQQLAREAEVVFAAAGVPRLVKPDWVSEGATVIDVGIHRIEDQSKKSGYGLIGDVDPSVAGVAGWLTPVPGGVGPMTIAYLLSNTLVAARARTGLATQDN